MPHHPSHSLFFFSSVCLYASVPTFIKLTHRILKLFPSPPNVPNNISISLSVGKKSSVLSHHLSSFSGVGVVMAMVVSAHGWTVNYSQKVSKKNEFVSLCILVIIQNLFKKDDNWFFKQNHFFSSCFFFKFVSVFLYPFFCTIRTFSVCKNKFQIIQSRMRNCIHTNIHKM